MKSDNEKNKLSTEYKIWFASIYWPPKKFFVYIIMGFQVIV